MSIATPHPPWCLTDFGTVTTAIFIVLAVRPWGTLGVLALDSPSHAGTALGTARGGPGLASLQKLWEEEGNKGLAKGRRPYACLWGFHFPSHSLGPHLLGQPLVHGKCVVRYCIYE